MKKSEAAANRCKTISMVQKLLGGKYKIELLWYIGKCDIRRFGSFAVRLEKLLKVVRCICNQQPFYVTDEDGEETDDLLNCENEKLPKEMMVAFE